MLLDPCTMHHAPSPPAHAQVYLATWKGTPVAVKVLKDDHGDALATLGSPVLDKLRAVREGGGGGV
jgi:hypothetical protein